MLPLRSTYRYLLPAMLAGSFVAQGQILQQDKQTKRERGLTVGINQGTEYNSRARKLNGQYGISLTKELSAKWKAAVGVNYNAPSTLTTGNIYTITAPATLQYYLLPKECKVKAFVGAGVQYTMPVNTPQTTPTNKEYIAKYSPNDGNNYISVVYTQGIIIEVNTKIQITQSFHFIDAGQEKRIGLNLGIGFKIP